MNARGASSLGSVALVGAGPGDPGLLTLRGLALLRGADVVVCDRLVSPAVRDLIPAHAEVVDLGKRSRTGSLGQAQVTDLLIAKAREGATVVRLKGGDPFVFGRGGEEAEALAREGVPFEVVPGVTSAVAGPSAAGVPITHRGVAASVALVTGHEADGNVDARVEWDAVSRMDTIVVLMGVKALGAIVERLLAAGRASTTPAAVVEQATLPTQRTIVGTLGSIVGDARRAGVGAPALVVVGDVVTLRETLGGRDMRPLSGRSVVVTRTREQASELATILLELGAEVLEAPAIEVRPPRSWRHVDTAIEQLRGGAFSWVVFTSANGVRMFASRLRAAGLDARAFAGTSVAAVGPGTAQRLGVIGITADLVPATFTTEAIGHAMPPGAGRVLLARADVVEPGLPEALAAKGWDPLEIVTYRLVGARRIAPDVRKRILGGGADVVTFASGGTVRAFVAALNGELPRSTKVVCIGPVTAKAARAAGLRVAKVADEHTVQGLAAAVLDAVASRAKPRARLKARS